VDLGPYSFWIDIVLYVNVEDIHVRIKRLIWLDEIVEKLARSMESFKMRLGKFWKESHVSVLSRGDIVPAKMYTQPWTNSEWSISHHFFHL